MIKYLPTIVVSTLAVYNGRFTQPQNPGQRAGVDDWRNLATQMGGDIILQSEPFAETTFTVQAETILKPGPDKKFVRIEKGI